MIDLHTHLLPGVDDGPDQEVEAVEMCRRAARHGCEVVVATPHQRHPSWSNTDSGRLVDLLGELQEAVGETPRLLLGAEIRIDSGLLDDLDDYPASGLLPLAGSRYLLLEADRSLPGPDPLELVHELKLRGWRPIFAHPEFIPTLYGDPEVLDELIALGAFLQVTAGSLLGTFGRRPYRIACDLMSAHQVHFVASDAHGVSWRPPDLGRARNLIASRWGEKTAARVCGDNARAVIDDRPLLEGAA